MNASARTLTAFILVFILISNCITGQHKRDSTRVLKNTVNLNFTNPLIFGKKYNVFGYERVLNDQSTLVVNIGRFSMPKINLVDLDSVNLDHKYREHGLNFSLEYRFYPGKENKYPAPRGLYFGPYYSYIMYERNNRWTLDTKDFNGDVDTDIRLNMNLIGIQMGYQFIIRKRLAVDFILIGPGKWFYSLRTKLDTTLDQEEQALIFDKLNDFLADKFPGYDLIIKPGSLRANGVTSSSSIGLRYMVRLGFRF